MTYTGADDRSD